MEKKFDFKTIAIACLLFFGFVFLLFYKFSSADDSLTHYKTALEIFDSQQSFDDFKATLPDKILPDDYTESESMVNMLYTLACFCMGDYIGVAEGLVTELSGQITGDPLFLQHFVFDYDSLCWVFDSDTDDFIKSKLDPYIYTSSGSTIGNWIKIPFDFTLSNNETIQFEPVSGGDVYICQSGDFLLLATRSSSGASFRYKRSSNLSQWYNNGCYPPPISGYYYSGCVTAIGLSPANGVFTPYANNSLAYSDFFGDTPVIEDSSLINGVSIRNQDFVVKPLSYPASVLVDYPNEITYPYYDPDDTRLTFEYTYTMEVPFWLKNPTTEPISYDLPTDYDFGNIEYEYEADPSYLAGAGIVQDVFEILPSTFQGLIALFGAGSLAFIFLRR